MGYIHTASSVCCFFRNFAIRSCGLFSCLLFESLMGFLPVLQRKAPVIWQVLLVSSVSLCVCFSVCVYLPKNACGVCINTYYYMYMCIIIMCNVHVYTLQFVRVSDQIFSLCACVYVLPIQLTPQRKRRWDRTT